MESMLAILYGICFGLNDFLLRIAQLPYIQTIPLAVFLSALILFYHRKRLCNYRFEALTFVGLWTYALVIATVGFILSYRAQGLTWLPILRQGASFFLAGIIFFGFRLSLVGRFIDVSTAMLVSALPFLFFGIFQRFSGVLAPFFPRIQGLFYEPSYYGDYLTLILLPSFVHILETKDNRARFKKGYLLLIAILLVANIIFVESGTALLKVMTLAGILFCFYPARFKTRVLILFSAAIFFIGSVFIFNGYIQRVWDLALDTLNNPVNFFHHHTLYDRLYPVYPALKSLLSWRGSMGLGFGADYFEFKNLYPAITHADMIATKPSLSYFNSFASKIFLYLGIPGLIAYLYLFIICLKTRKPMIKIGLLNALLASLWGIANFSLPYLWLWLALALNDGDQNE